MTGQTYRSNDAGTILCYRRDSSPFASLALVAASGTRPTTTVLGDPSLLTNDRIGEPGVASLTTGLLGTQPRLVWWRPSAGDPLAFPADDRPQITDLIPPWVGWVALQLLIAAAVTAYVMGRRMGRIVMEPLPSVVRASEASEGLGRLYRRGGARGRAASVLAAATSARLRIRLGLARTAPTAELVAAVADRTSWTVADISALLDPAPPTSDADLVQLADALDSLERQVRRP